MGANVFLSYSLEDSGLARQVAESLSRQGVVTMLTDDLPKGSKWTDALRRDLERSDGAVVIASDASLNNRHVMFEVGAFQASNKPVMTLRPAGAVKPPNTSPLAMFFEIDAARLTPDEIATTIRSRLEPKP